MKLPDYVEYCLSALENAGFAAYVVGGCVRDACLGLIPQDYDSCTIAIPEDTKRVFFDKKLVLSGQKHGTIGVVFGNIAGADRGAVCLRRNTGAYRC